VQNLVPILKAKLIHCYDVAFSDWKTDPASRQATVVRNIWRFVRGSESILVVDSRTHDGASQLSVEGPGPRMRIYAFDDPQLRIEFQSMFEEHLMTTGFVMEDVVVPQRETGGALVPFLATPAQGSDLN
jgi:hypothetical protein